MKRILMTLGSFALVALLGVTMVGRYGVDAQESATPSAGTSSESAGQSKRDTWIATLAGKLGVTTDQLKTAIEETNSELGIEGMLNGRGSNGGNGIGRGHNGRSNGSGHFGSQLRGVGRAEAAAFLGISEDELNTEMESGKTFLQVAADHGKTSDDVRAFLVQQATAAIDAFMQDAENAETAPTATPTA